MKMFRAILICLLLCSMFRAIGQQTDGDIFRGNEMYRQQEYEKARAFYEKALARNKADARAHYNEGAAFMREKKFENANASFENAISNSSDSKMQQQAWYNKGVSQVKQQKLEESIAAWKEALKMDPNDKETRENLEKALRELNKKKQSQNQDKKNKQKKQQKEQDQPQKPQSKLSQQRVDQLLKALQQKEKEVNARLNQQKVPAPSRPDKDW